jgi:hypothetical protein
MSCGGDKLDVVKNRRLLGRSGVSERGTLALDELDTVDSIGHLYWTKKSIYSKSRGTQW